MICFWVWAHFSPPSHALVIAAFHLTRSKFRNVLITAAASTGARRSIFISASRRLRIRIFCVCEVDTHSNKDRPQPQSMSTQPPRPRRRSDGPLMPRRRKSMTIRTSSSQSTLLRPMEFQVITSNVSRLGNIHLYNDASRTP